MTCSWESFVVLISAGSAALAATLIGILRIPDGETRCFGKAVEAEIASAFILERTERPIPCLCRPVVALVNDPGETPAAVIGREIPDISLTRCGASDSAEVISRTSSCAGYHGTRAGGSAKTSTVSPEPTEGSQTTSRRTGGRNERTQGPRRFRRATPSWAPCVSASSPLERSAAAASSSASLASRSVFSFTDLARTAFASASYSAIACSRSAAA